MNKSKSSAPPAPSRPTRWGRVPSAGSTRRATVRYRCSPAQTRATRCATRSAERRPGRRPLETVIDGRYRVLDRIGSGGTAAVYRAEDLVLGRTVALKLLHDCFAQDQEFVERFRLEASRQAGLHHRHIVSVFDRGEWDGTHYIAMEYVPGRSLKSLIREEAPLAPEHAIELVVQLLHAARYIHGRGIIHRDLKPDNAIVGSDGQLKLTDFGISRAGASDLTQTGTVLGTAQYVAPEQAEGHAVSAATDLYSIGVILYELLTGRVPFEGETVVAILLQHVKERPITAERAQRRRAARARRNRDAGAREAPRSSLRRRRRVHRGARAREVRAAISTTPSPRRRSGWGSFTGRGWQASRVSTDVR